MTPYLIPCGVLKGDVGIGEMKGMEKVGDDFSPILVISTISYHLPISFSYLITTSLPAAAER